MIRFERHMGPTQATKAGYTTPLDYDLNLDALAKMFPDWYKYVGTPLARTVARTVATIIVSRKPGAVRPKCHERGRLEGVISGAVG